MIRTSTVTPTITAGAYSANDAVGGKMEFEDICTPYSNDTKLKAVVITDKGAQAAKLYLVLFSEDFTATADNAEFDPSDSDLLNMVGVVTIATTDYADFKDNAVATHVLSQPLPLELVEGGTSLFGQLMVETSTPTYTATSDLQVTLVVES